MPNSAQIRWQQGEGEDWSPRCQGKYRIRCGSAERGICDHHVQKVMEDVRELVGFCLIVQGPEMIVKYSYKDWSAESHLEDYHDRPSPMMSRVAFVRPRLTSRVCVFDRSPSCNLSFHLWLNYGIFK